MSGKQPLQPLTASVEQSTGALDAPDRRLQVGETLPAACDVKDLARAFGRSINTIYDWERAGKLRRFELARPLDSHRWSGRKVLAFLDGPTAFDLLRKRA